jgi:GT2 family glycosyltransferase
MKAIDDPKIASSAEIVKAVYRQVFRREADPGGLKHHVHLLDSGKSKARDIIRSFLQSQEWRTRFVDGHTRPEILITLFDCALARPADMKDFRKWEPILSRKDWAQVIDELIDGPEYVERFGNDTVPHKLASSPRDSAIAQTEVATEAPISIPREPAASPLASPPDVRAIAFYLPQFHRVRENDEWWGEGFTEWTSVRSGRPRFEKHYQPHVPSALGYYDLGEAAAFEKQANLARSYGIHGFCLYYYWFDGKVLLDLPLRHLLESGPSDFPFCICWANENWTRRWDGKDQDILISQRHSPEDDLAFIRHIEPILLSKNYIRVDGKPMLLVYRASLLPDAAATAERWRACFRERGHGELHLVMVRSFTESRPHLHGFDAMVQFPPHTAATPITRLIQERNKTYKGHVYDYSELKRKFTGELETAPSKPRLYAGVMPSWDNTARHGERATVWLDSSPELYREWLSAAARYTRRATGTDDRLLFINAWNEWAEGCHLEPDEKYGFAWLNATAMALDPSQAESVQESQAVNYPAPPAPNPVDFPALPAVPKLVISVLFYHREDLICPFLESLLPQVKEATALGAAAVDLYLVFNYRPPAALPAETRQLIAALLPAGKDSVYLIENGFNAGFGAGHNSVFNKRQSDIFLSLNNDVRIAKPDWLRTLVERFRVSGAAIVGLTANASRLREDGCGIPVAPGGGNHDFVDGSVLAVRSELARRYGLFSEEFDYFYFEDADLCLRFRQLGLTLDLLDLPCEHERSSSSRLLPQFAVERVLDRNRARFFQRWGSYLKTRELPNRLAVRFLTIDRQLQCASLPAIFGLLSEHPGAILDLHGVHEQVSPFFRHPRVRLIPFWQTLRETDYLRYYEVGEYFSSQEAKVLAIAGQIGCRPDFAGARSHLRSLHVPNSARGSNKCGNALLVLTRREPLFDGRQPSLASFDAIRKLLSDCGWSVSVVTDLGRPELAAIPTLWKQKITYTGTSSGREILQAVLESDLVVSCDNWISELSQLLDKKTFIWLGATSATSALWNLEKTGVFNDRSLPCLGCYHRFGRDRRNICLRGDVACMQDRLAAEFSLAFQRFIDGQQVTAAQWEESRRLGLAGASSLSTALTLDSWPSSRASSVLVLIPINPTLTKEARDRTREMAQAAIRGMKDGRVVLDDQGTSPPRGVPHPLRQHGMAAIRQAMVERYLTDERWIFWVDSDIVKYPANLIDELIGRAEGGIAAPLVLMEGDVSEPLSNKYGFGPGRFYDVAGFVENGRWARFTEPYFDQPGPVYELDSVGSCYLLNADLYRQGARHEIDFASKKFLLDDCVWQEDAIARNQSGSAICFSEHYSVCEFTRRAGLPVRAFADLVACHEKLPAPSRAS